MATAISYATREDVKAALDVAETARRDAQIDRCLEAGSRSVDALCHRVFFPELRTMTWDWPNSQSPTFDRLWLDDNELIELITAESGGVTIPPGNLLLRPDQGPPFTYVETDDSSSSVFAAGATTQRAVSFYGLYGFRADETTAGALASSVNNTQSTVDVTNSAAVGVGSLLHVDSERMIVTEKSMLTTGQTLQADPGDKASGTTISVASGAAFADGEVILIDGERMRIDDIAGNTLVVKRAVDGSTLAAHAIGATIYAPRRCTVTRGVLGTTAAAHSAIALAQQKYPPLVRNLTIAEAIVGLGHETGGYGQSIRAGESAMKLVQSISDLRDQVYRAHGRKVRMRAVGR